MEGTTGETASQGGNSDEISKLFGSKSIGYFAGIALLVNNITGPGVPQLPNLFVESGWLLPALCIIVVWFLTSLSSAMFCEAMRHIPGNEHFVGRAEYTTIVKHYFGRKMYIVSQVGLNGALQALNIISVIQSVRVMDNAISALFGKTCGLNFTPFGNAWTSGTGVRTDLLASRDFFSCVDTNYVQEGNAWGCHMLLTPGFLVTAAMAIPCGVWNLDDNMKIQQATFALTVLCWLVWFIACSSEWDASSLPALNTNPTTSSQAGVLGTILFNFGFVTTVPSWVNEKRPDVSVNKTVWAGTSICVVVFFAIGLGGAAAFSDILQGVALNKCARQEIDPGFNCANSLMEALANPATMPSAWQASPTARLTLRLSMYLFPVVAVVSSIPVFSIVIKYNMVENGFSKRAGFLWGVVLPWLLAFPLLRMPNVLNQFIDLTSLFFVTFTDFIVPLLLYVQLQRRQGGDAEHAHANSMAKSEASTSCESSAVSEAAGCSKLGELPASSSASSHIHNSLPECLNVSRRTKIYLSIVIAVILGAAACLAIAVSISEAQYSFDQQTCALVGS